LILSAMSGNALSSSVKGSKNKLDSISLYMVNVTKARNFSHSTWHNRQHLFIAMKSGEHTGWAEVLASKNDLNFDIANWGSFMKPLIGSGIDEAIEFGRKEYFAGNWNAKTSEPALMGLYDLMGKIANKPTIDIWGLTGNKPVPAVFTILEREVDKALEQAATAKEQGLTSHVKVKLFGEFELDLQLITAMREFFGKDTKIIGDPNRGYKHLNSIEEVAEAMIKLNEAGMDAVEDPSELDKAGWIELESKVGKLALVPDHIMRPAHKGIDIFSPDMGSYFNLHPNTMGTYVELNKLASKIKESGKGLMVGDSSLIGPACTFWQQIAIGNGAAWVEAIEKPQESDVLSKCVEVISTKLNQQGEIELVKKNPGFGLAINESKLKELSDKYATV
jgi:L-alanine-DL-glutamate epimerase-like enolase superfamily enzyme